MFEENFSFYRVRCLEKPGTVHGIELDYSRFSHELAEQVRAAVVRHGITLLVGTSMGGWLAARMGRQLNLPYGAPIYMVLTGGSKSKGRLNEGTFDGIPVIGCRHPVQGADLQERSEAMTRLDSLIK
ncbi:hypothetical protein [Fodinicurvata fenggangensis]|uniref:hypothetical protein n=1 Tax=Fodinicurvata fenggangensis TaxID=1121830 RepID=UPI000479EDA4|nr:hypothetical protein [Fodinicurvata fenggangensis]